MTRQAGIYGIIALIGLAIGMIAGVLVMKQKVSKANMIIEQMQTQQSQTETKLQAATAKVSQYETELIKSRNNTTQMNMELARAKADLIRMKNLLEQPAGQGQPAASATGGESTTTTRPVSSITSAPTTAPAGVATPLAVGVREYTVKDGDNFWDIATAELGKGTRYKEILKLNPQLTEKSTLKVGSKIKIPAK